MMCAYNGWRREEKTIEAKSKTRLSEALKKWRRGKTLTQEEAARILGVGYCTYVGWDGGFHTPHAKQLREVAAKIGAEPSDLI